MKNTNNLKYREISILLTWIKGQEAFEELANNDFNISNTKESNFKWENHFNLSLMMVKVGLGEQNAQLEDKEFEEIFERSLEVFNNMHFTEAVDKLKNFQDFDMVQEISDKMGFDVEISENQIKEELKKLYEYKNIIDNVFENYVFEKTELKENQLEILETTLKKYILNEEYEKCSDLKIKIEKIKNGTI